MTQSSIHAGIFYFKYKDYTFVSKKCLELFEDYVEITALIHAVKEIMHAGIVEYQHRENEGYRFLHHNYYGFKTLAAILTANMLKKIYDGPPEKFAEKFMAVKKWCEFWKIEPNLDINLKDIYDN